MKDEMMTQVPEELVITKPAGKPDKRTKGFLCQWAGTDFVAFQPSGTGQANAKTILVSKPGVTFYKNEGRTQQSFSVYANVGGKSLDPAGDLLHNICSALAPQTKKEVKVPTAKFLMDEQGCKVWHRKDKRQLVCHIELDASQDKYFITEQLLRVIQEVNKVIGIAKL